MEPTPHSQRTHALRGRDRRPRPRPHLAAVRGHPRRGERALVQGAARAGQAGVALQALGVGEASLAAASDGRDARGRWDEGRRHDQTVTDVCSRALELADRTGADTVGTLGRAGAAATEQALRHGDAKLIVVFCSDAYDLDALLGAINHRSQGAPLIGCSTAGEIATSGPGQASVVVTALGGEGFSVTTAAGDRRLGRSARGGS